MGIITTAWPHQCPIRLLGWNYPLYNYIYIMTSRGSVLAQPGLHIPPPRLLSSCSAGRHVDSPDRMIWHLYSPRSQAIINRIMSRSSVRYLILSNAKKSPPTYANAVFAAPVGRDTAWRAKKFRAWEKWVGEASGWCFLSKILAERAHQMHTDSLILLYIYPKGIFPHHWPSFWHCGTGVVVA